jgi:hypothetical protein
VLTVLLTICYQLPFISSVTGKEKSVLAKFDSVTKGRILNEKESYTYDIAKKILDTG